LRSQKLQHDSSDASELLAVNFGPKTFISFEFHDDFINR
jgi:hypothetical protein